MPLAPATPDLFQINFTSDFSQVCFPVLRKYRITPVALFTHTFCALGLAASATPPANITPATNNPLIPSLEMFFITLSCRL
jgi:hypothetical protein